MKEELEAGQLTLIDSIVKHYIENQELFNMALNSLQGYITMSSRLKPYIHSFKFRLKDPTHLKDKLIRKAIKGKKNGEEFTITKENVFSEINDLAGFRIIHLHTTQIEQINIELTKIFNEQQWAIIEPAKARTWDDESREYFKNIGIDIHKPESLSMYTSVHYVIKPNSSSLVTCEVQVRTLMEEVWGEVDHTINYPHKSNSHSCREQIKALARATSSCSRLVDSIFSTDAYESARKPELAGAAKESTLVKVIAKGPIKPTVGNTNIKTATKQVSAKKTAIKKSPMKKVSAKKSAAKKHSKKK